MALIRVSQAARMLGVSPDTVRRWADAGRLQVERGSGGRRLVDTVQLARVMAEQGQKPESLVHQSARNAFPGMVTNVVRDRVMAQVEVQAGPFRVVSLMSREAADELALEPGTMVVASVKATNVVVQLP